MCVVILRILRRCAVTAVLILSAATAVIACAIASVLAGRVICPTAVGVAAVRCTPVDGFAAVSADILPVAAAPDALRAAVRARLRLRIAAKRADATGTKAVRAGMTVGIFVRRAVVARLPDVMGAGVLGGIVVAPTARAAGAAADAAVSRQHGGIIGRNDRESALFQRRLRHDIIGQDDKSVSVYACEGGTCDAERFIVVI